MIKRTINTASSLARVDPDWLRLDEVAEVEISSENPAHPIEAALTGGDERGWRADNAGSQTIRLIFQPPREVRQIRIVVEEKDRDRTQQFTLRAATGADGSWRELARQQFNFNPAATREQEDYRVNLPMVTTLELTLVPDISGGDARASLREFRVA
jgi:hypothetical protein